MECHLTPPGLSMRGGLLAILESLFYPCPVWVRTCQAPCGSSRLEGIEKFSAVTVFRESAANDRCQ